MNSPLAIKSSASSASPIPLVYTDSEPGRSIGATIRKYRTTDGGVPRVIVYGYDGLPMQPVDPPSPDYVPAGFEGELQLHHHPYNFPHTPPETDVPRAKMPPSEESLSYDSRSPEMDRGDFSSWDASKTARLLPRG
ncbi:hypothetical protein Tco_0650331 [Tanacetum coccineum]